MSAQHRQHTLDIPANPTPIEQIPYRRDGAILRSPKEPSLILWPPFLLVVAALAIGFGYAAILHAGRATAEVTPVHQAQAVAAPLEPLQMLDGAQLAQIRIEAFRAGMETAQDNCAHPFLSMPIAPRR